MLRFDVVTIFPELFNAFLMHGVTRRAFSKDIMPIKVWNLRDFAQNNYRRIDDRAFGGGPGMIMMAEPIARCFDTIIEERNLALSNSEHKELAIKVIFFTPEGEKINQNIVEHWSASTGAILLCGRYEGVDQRLIDSYVTHKLSLGDFVLSGGEIGAIALLDSVARLQNGVLGNSQSCRQDSFHADQSYLLDCPHYTRPAKWRGLSVPSVLLSGDHDAISQWRRKKKLQISLKLRPELIDRARASERLSLCDEFFLKKRVKL